MDLHALALPTIAVLAVLAFAFARCPEPPRCPDAVERGSTTILPEDR